MANQTDASSSECYKWVLTETDTDSGWGCVYLVVDENAQKAIKKKKKEQTILHPLGQLTVISSGHDVHFTGLISNNGQRDILPQSNSLIENWNAQLKY